MSDLSLGIGQLDNDQLGGVSIQRTSPPVRRAGYADNGIVTAAQIRVFPFAGLSPAMLQRWESVRRDSLAESSGHRDHPFFSPRFASAVQAARGDVLVAVAFSGPVSDACSSDAADAIGFLPFHRIGRIGLPVGRFLNDAQNVIGLASERIDWSQWMRACDVAAFELHAIIQAEASWISDYRLQEVKAFRADFEGDSPAFLRRLEREHRTIGKQGQKTRKLEREFGPLRLEIDCRCPDVLEQAITWKRAQYQRTHILDLFLPDWTRRLIQVLHEPGMLAGTQSCDSMSFADESLRGLLSVLRAGDHVVAAHIGMIERGQLHYWFPTYDPAFSRCSPGTALFTEIVRAATLHGIDGIDMGYGEQPYKQKQTGTTSRVAFGIITDSKWQRVNYRFKQQAVACLKRMPMKEFFKKGWRTIHPTAGIQKLS
ncbi:GNAT family N-acetyltransferase [Neorhodopirellula pilleata]|uniref:BioF2-like acetyltransferase domain-containing protein n=1 Tax=Neorhodopirellula pilleata TaxID=2714738 RepID=A0A5C6AQY6_9BACT|nr:GNAT family N-acetyltransferase [Neorhodopirellula pilleata]TWU01907.1 hypothetical protein Pla100_16430 [Neorhodopirellula pilleata]